MQLFFCIFNFARELNVVRNLATLGQFPVTVVLFADTIISEATFSVEYYTTLSFLFCRHLQLKILFLISMLLFMMELQVFQPFILESLHNHLEVLPCFLATGLQIGKQCR